MFKRIAIVNRGEAAMRLIHAVRDLNAEQPDADPTTVIALYTDAERTAMFAREADEAFPLGPAAERPYLNHALLAATLAKANADAVWVGTRLLASFEDQARARGCTHVFVTSFTFQAPGFYERHGYREIFRWQGVPTPDAADVHFRKDL